MNSPHFSPSPKASALGIAGLPLPSFPKGADIANVSCGQLLTALWRSGDQIHQVGSLDRRTQKFHNQPVNDIGEAIRIAQSLSGGGKDAYLACAEYVKPDSRTAANAFGAHAFWMDIDCGKAKAAASKGYLTEADARAALEKFCGDAELPMPTHIVSSGGGLHIYWVLDRVADRETWQTYAGKLKALTKALGFLADDSRTADIASVLRVPGTLNFKYQPPRPVTLLEAAETHLQQACTLAAIDRAYSRLCRVSAKGLRAPSPKIRLDASKSDLSNYGPPDLEKLASALTALDPDCDESEWKLQRLAPLARLAGQYPDVGEKLRTLAQAWSNGKLRGKASAKWSTHGSNGKTGEQEFECVWQRFLDDGYSGNQTTLGTIYHDAKTAGWIDAFKNDEQFKTCVTTTISAEQAVPEAKGRLSVLPKSDDFPASNKSMIAPPAVKTESDPVSRALATIQEQYALINMDGKVWVLDGHLLLARNEKGSAQKLVLSSRLDGAILIKRAVKAQFPEAKAETIFDAFLLSPQTVCYDGVEFNPSGKSGKHLNLWVGPTINAKAGEWTLIKGFLLDVICNSDPKCYAYLISYIAHALQRPEEKPGVMIVLLGGQGIGKGTLGRILRKIWNATYLQISNIDAVTGNFNAALERAFIVFMDEALFSGNRRASDALKSLVTEETVYINEKHQPARQVQSYHRFIAATNADHFKNTERDDRRDFTLRVSEARKGDHTYWAALSDEIEHGGVEAMAHDLLAMDLDGFNVRIKPETTELLAQKLQSLGPIPRWWHDFLSAGSSSEDGGWPTFIGTENALKEISEMAGGKLFQKPVAADFVREMRKLCSSAEPRQMKPTGTFGGRQRGLLLPPLQQARTEFEQYIGGPVAWESEVALEVVEPQPNGKKALQGGM